MIRTSRALIKQGCRLITRPNLNLHEVGAFVVAVVCVFALDLRIVDIFPGFFPAEHIVDLFGLELHFVFELVLDAEDVGACFAKEAEVI